MRNFQMINAEKSFIRFSQLIIEEMFGDQPEEFVC